MLFNNRIYGLTKGQYSPTSPLGQVHQEHAAGLDRQSDPSAVVAIGCEATFVARSIDVEYQAPDRWCSSGPPHHKGTAFVEVYQNCNVFNDGRLRITPPIARRRRRQRRRTRARQAADLRQEPRQGHPPQRNAAGRKSLSWAGDINEDDLLFHDEKAAEPTLAYLLGPHALSRVSRTDGRVPRRPAAHLR